ncbi:MAG: acetyl-CoA carboxylase, biotin carboxyl carrier protein [Flavobacteriales bacterium]|nr:acetyl-CoA carboxylase, biotin carboxyl carrier protein [Flavobacteriales bacterium]MBO72936.1 acetyl-CoA carboxylase, biotin carboxyl carrier protein [Flavobacteriales bacterium]|tara:strand:+ start:533 stop:1087 length:555 start_codon:yes stop_codon:yes gene_type:complete
MKATEIQDLIKFVSKSGVSEVNLETKDVKLTIKNDAVKRKKTGSVEPQIVQVPVPQVVQQPVTAPIAAPAPVAPAPVAAAAPAPAAVSNSVNEESVSEAVEDTSKYVEIKSPMIGTFYRRPSPDKPNFVEVGTEIKKGDVICIIEAMKLFNEIEAEVTGKVVKTLVDDSTPVEYDQPLFVIDPS